VFGTLVVFLNTKAPLDNIFVNSGSDRSEVIIHGRASKKAFHHENTLKNFPLYVPSTSAVREAA
jgi:hypothetical protein